MGQLFSSIWRWLSGGTNKRATIQPPPQPPHQPPASHRINTTTTTSTSVCDVQHDDNNTTIISFDQVTDHDHDYNNYGYGYGDKVSVVGLGDVIIRSIGLYRSCQRILLVGEGDFSFSASLAMAFGSASNMVSTSLDSFEFLEKNYRRSMNNIHELKARGCIVLHEIDVKQIANHPLLCSIKYDCIIFNFPHAGFFGRHVPRETQIGINQELLRLFMANAKTMIEVDGEIHITHKSYGFFRQWNLQKLGLSQGLWLIEEVNFERTDYPGYHTKYGFGGDKNFDCSNSRTYRFGLMTSRSRRGNGIKVITTQFC